jgi:hypothetical protein
MAVDGAQENAEHIEERLGATRFESFTRERGCVGGVFQLASYIQDARDTLLLLRLSVLDFDLLGDRCVDDGSALFGVRRGHVGICLGLIDVCPARVVHCYLIYVRAFELNNTSPVYKYTRPNIAIPSSFPIWPLDDVHR